MRRVAGKARGGAGERTPGRGRRREAEAGAGQVGETPRGRKKKEPPDPFADTSPLGLLKREAAERLGLLEKVRALGWAGLSAAETGRVGALVSRLARERGDGGRRDPDGA